MDKELRIHTEGDQDHVVLLEDGQAVEYRLVHPQSEYVYGRVYKGRVQRVVPGLAAAFVDIGLEKNAFLPLQDQGTNDVQQRNEIRQGQEIMVQVRKEPQEQKGAKVSTNIQVTREQRRTMVEKAEQVRAPTPLTPASSPLLAAIEDLLPEVHHCWVDHRERYDHLHQVIEQRAWKEKIFLVRDDAPLFDPTVNKVLKRACQPKVWLKGGGFIIIEHTSSLTSIDVNTGRYLGKKDVDKTLSTTNQEAAVEIARQLRLREIGGIVLIDFIKMKQIEDKRELLQQLKQALAQDRNKTEVKGMTPSGLVEVVREKRRKSWREMK